MKKLLSFLLAAWLTAAANAPALAEGSRAGCRVCGMYTDLYQRTAGEVTMQGGEKAVTCGVACLLRIVQDEGGPDAFAAIRVRDWESGEPTPAATAVYVIGSRKIPDMLPSLIAFRNPAAAEAFQKEEGGQVLDFAQALNAVSPMGMTMPTRITAAVLPPQGAFGIGAGSMAMRMDEVLTGSSEVDPAEFIRRPGQMMGPKEMTSAGTMLMASYGLTDTLALSAKASYLEKEMEMYAMGGNAVQTKENSGLTDVALSLRYNLWRDDYFSRFVSVLAGVTLPTGDFEAEYLASPGLQLGAGDFGFTGGLLYSLRWRQIWLHTLASYTHFLENSDHYQFGGQARAGLALHYTPNYNLMLGLELDGVHQEKNERQGLKVGNTGGFRSVLSVVADWKFLTALGGNFTLRPSAGIPVYEDLNHERSGMSESVQLGGGYFVSVAVNFKRRIRVD